MSSYLSIIFAKTNRIHYDSYPIQFQCKAQEGNFIVEEWLL
jgi:hypothetical protein